MNYEEYDEDVLEDGEDNSLENILDEEEISVDLQVDLYEDADYLYIKGFVPGTTTDNLDIDITRDMVTIIGSRSEFSEVSEENYFQKELSWGSYTRKILLPKEIDIEESDAKIRNGILSIKLPKIDKDRKRKIKAR